jgi:hypothetical protein
MLTSDILDRVAALDAAALCDADKNIRVMDVGLRPVSSSSGRWSAAPAPCAAGTTS